MSVPRSVLAFALVGAMLALAAMPTAAAHASKTTADGKYTLTWGFLDEPAFTEDKNKLDLVIRDATTRAGVGNINTSELKVSLRYGDEEYPLGAVSNYTRGKAGAFAGPGNYTAANAVVLTRPGIYTLVVKGSILGTPVDLEIPQAHETEDIEEIEFPPIPEEDAELEARVAKLEQEIAALKAQAQTQSSTPATVVTQTPTATGAADNGIPAAGAVLGVLGLAVVAISLRRRG